MIKRPWAYLAILAVTILWGLPEIIAWALIAWMAADIIRLFLRPGWERLHQSYRESLTEVTDDTGQTWRIDGDRMTAVCQHPGAIEVRRLPVPAVGVTDDLVAWYCPGCHEQLPPEFIPARPGETVKVVPMPDGWGKAAGRISAEQRAVIASALARGANTPAAIWVSDQPVCHCSGRGHTGECPADIRAAGYEPIECPALGQPSIWVRGEHLPTGVSVAQLRANRGIDPRG